MGWMREARRAGTNPASKATRRSSRIIATNVIASVGCVPKSSEAIPGYGNGGNCSRDDSEQSERQSLFEDIKLHSCMRGAESHADTDLVGSARDRVRNHSVNAKRGQGKAKHSKEDHQQQKEAPRRDGTIDDALDRLNSEAG